MSIVEGPPAAGQPTTKVTTEVIESDPTGVPMDTKTTSVTKTKGARFADPPVSAADPGGAGGGAGPPVNTAANVPGAGAGKPGKAAPKPATVWDTNHSKPVPATTVNNVPNAPGPGGGGPGGGGPPPAMVEADNGNVPSGPPPAGPPAGAAPGPPGAAGAPPPANLATPAPAAGKVGGLWWEPHLPVQARLNDTPK